MKYDDASWHYGGDFPADSPEEYGGVHIALFMKWCFAQGWVGDLHGEEEPEDVEKVIYGELSATEFFFKYCDGKLTDEDFNEEGNQFASEYYGDNGLYLNDYANNFGDLMYVAKEETHDFAALSKMIQARRKSGILTEAQAKNTKPWWRVW